MSQRLDGLPREGRSDMTRDAFETAGRRWLLHWEGAMLDHAAIMRARNTTPCSGTSTNTSFGVWACASKFPLFIHDD
jgi:hypothetical protein